MFLAPSELKYYNIATLSALKKIMCGQFANSEPISLYLILGYA